MRWMLLDYIPRDLHLSKDERARLKTVLRRRRIALWAIIGWWFAATCATWLVAGTIYNASAITGRPTPSARMVFAIMSFMLAGSGLWIAFTFAARQRMHGLVIQLASAMGIDTCPRCSHRLNAPSRQRACPECSCAPGLPQATECNQGVTTDAHGHPGAPDAM